MSQVIAGRNPVLEALSSDQAIEKIFILHGQRGEAIGKIIALARQRKIQVVTLDRARFAQMSPLEKSQGVLARIAEVRTVGLDDILEVARRRHQPPVVALLDEIEDPHNLGAIIRSAECTGVHGIVIPRHRSAGLTEIVAKTSAGALSHLAVARVTNLNRAIDDLKAAGLWIAGTSAEAEQRVDQADFTGPLGIVIGSEGKGIRRLVQQHCDFMVRIPIVGKITSLNASVAAGIMFYEIARQRHFYAP